MIVAGSIAAVAFFFVLRWLSFDETAETPDALEYIKMARRERATRPFSGRILLPVLAQFWRRDPKAALRFLSTAGVAASVAVVYALVLHFGGTHPAAASAAIAWVCVDSAVGVWLGVPYLVDGWALAFVGIAIMAPTPMTAMGFLALAAITKESAAVLGAAYLLAFDPTSAATVIPPTVFFAVVAHMLFRHEPPTRACLRHPVKTAFRRKRQTWFHYKRSLGGLRACVPLVAYGLTLLEPRQFAAVCVALVASYLQVFAASDHARLIAMGFFFAVPACIAVVPEQIALLAAAACVFWPINLRVESWA